MKTYIEINSSKLIHNLTLFHNHTNRKLIFVVKANAYGHGLKEVIEITKSLDFIEYYSVDSIEEALLIRRFSDKKILIIGWLDRQGLIEAINNEFEIVIPSTDYVKFINEVATSIDKEIKGHLKIETGTTRMGIEINDAIRLINEKNDYLNIKGLYSHFANIEDTTDHSYAKLQLKLFNNFLNKINKDNYIKHFSCSASSLLFPDTYFDYVRVGISAYGYWPSKETFISFKNKFNKDFELKPVLSWYSKVAQKKRVKANTPIGYGLTYKTLVDSDILVIPVGYYDGYDRRLSNNSNIIINNKKAPVRGRICMNMFMVDSTHIEGINQGDRVILIGKQGNEEITADELANLSSTINYEILSRINPLIPKLIV